MQYGNPKNAVWACQEKGTGWFRSPIVLNPHITHRL